MIRKIVVVLVDLIAWPVGKAIDKACASLNNLDGE